MEGYTATIGEKTIKCTLDEWPAVAAKARQAGQKAYLVSNLNNQVIAEA